MEMATTDSRTSNTPAMRRWTTTPFCTGLSKGQFSTLCACFRSLQKHS